MTSPQVSFLRRMALLEGASFLLLLGVAMPLKYLAHMPMAVKVVGWAHGLLFVLFLYGLLQVMMSTKWPLGRYLVIFISALLPFGPFLIDRRMLEWSQEATE